jgi:hypothetical protein
MFVREVQKRETRKKKSEIVTERPHWDSNPQNIDRSMIHMAFPIPSTFRKISPN